MTAIATHQPIDRLLSVETVADILGVPQATLRAWRSRGEGPESFVIGRRKVVYRESVITAWIAECEASSARGDR